MFLHTFLVKKGGFSGVCLLIVYNYPFPNRIHTVNDLLQLLNHILRKHSLVFIPINHVRLSVKSDHCLPIVYNQAN